MPLKNNGRLFFIFHQSQLYLHPFSGTGLVTITSASYPSRCGMTTVPAFTGAVSVHFFISSIASKIRSRGMGFVSLTLARGSIPPFTNTDVAIFLWGSVNSCSTYALPFGHAAPSTEQIRLVPSSLSSICALI